MERQIASGQPALGVSINDPFAADRGDGGRAGLRLGVARLRTSVGSGVIYAADFDARFDVGSVDEHRFSSVSECDTRYWILD
jgi:hypothetical protein